MCFQCILKSKDVDKNIPVGVVLLLPRGDDCSFFSSSAGVVGFPVSVSGFDLLNCFR